MRFGCVSSDGNATSLSKTSSAVRLWDSRAERDLAVPVDADDPALRRDGMHDTKTMLIKQRIELSAQSAEPAGLHLDEFAISTNEMDHEPAKRRLNAIARSRKEGLDRRVQRTFPDHPDP